MSEENKEESAVEGVPEVVAVEGKVKADEEEEVPVPEIDPVETASLDEALALAQAKFPQVPTNRDSDYTTKKGQRIKYKWADIGQLRKYILPVLSPHGLSVRQDVKTVVDGTGFPCVLVKTILSHSSGVSVESAVIGLQYNAKDPKDLGKSITYGCRYSFQNFLSVPIVDGEDLDKESDPSDREKWAKDASEQLPKFLERMNNLELLIKNPPPRSLSSHIDENDQRNVFKLLKNTTWDTDILREKILTIYGKNSTKELTVGEYNKLVDLILALPTKTKVVDANGEVVIVPEEPPPEPAPIDPNSLSGRFQGIKEPHLPPPELEDTTYEDAYDKPF